MASESVGGSAETAQPSASPKKPMPKRRQRKLIIAIVAIAAALIVVFWGWSSTGAKSYLQVSSLADNPTAYLNESVEVQGIIVDWPGGANLSFSLADKADPNKTVSVVLIGTLPAEFSNGKTAVVKGELSDTLPLRLTATDITLGCASRY